MNHEQFAAAIQPNIRVLIAALVPGKGDEDRSVVTEVTQDVAAHGAIVVGTLIQRRGVSRARSPGGVKKLSSPLTAATYIGKGKAAELAELVDLTRAEIVVFCNPLTGTQRRNLEQATGATVIWYRPSAPIAVDQLSGLDTS